jgi:hypothetical protein
MAPTMLAAILQPLMLPLPSAMILPPPLGAWCMDAMLTSPRAPAPVVRQTASKDLPRLGFARRSRAIRQEDSEAMVVLGIAFPLHEDQAVAEIFSGRVLLT